MVAAVVAAGVEKDARAKARFFGAVEGGYAAGDQFVGVRVPVLRRLAREARRQVSLADVEQALGDARHEVRLLGAILLVEFYKLDDDEARHAAAVRVLLEHADRFNNWDLVDTVAPYTLGPWLLTRPQERIVLDRLIVSPLVWERRMALVATFALIRAGAYDDLLRLAGTVLADPHDLIHKAAGWMLREVGARDKAVLDGFRQEHAAQMPRVMLRYALEKHSAPERKAFLARSPDNVSLVAARRAVTEHPNTP